MSTLIPRRALGTTLDRLASARGVIVNGPRQSGKSELLRILHGELDGTLATLDVPAQLRVARTDPMGFVSDRAYPLLIDEVQRGGDPLVLALKVLLDSSRDPGRVVLAGSTRFLTEPRLSESLAGRVRFVDLWPLSQGEIDGSQGPNLLALLSGSTRRLRTELRGLEGESRPALYERVCRGGFPEAVLAPSSKARRRFFTDYVRTVSQRDIVEMSRIAQRVDLPRVLRFLAGRTGTILNKSTLANDVGMSADSMSRYLPLIETIFLTFTLPAWSRSPTAGIRRRPKVHLTDAGLAAALTGMTPERMLDPSTTFTGQLFETFVVTELLKLMSWHDEPVELLHYRDGEGREADVIVESFDGRIAAIEVKAALGVNDHDIRHLGYLRDRSGEGFTNGVILYCGDAVLPLGDRLTALPVNALWC